jgi:small conductance mechanosensitive channel
MSATQILSALVPIGVAAAVAIGGFFLSRAAAAWLRHRGAPPYGVRAVRIVLSVVGLVLAAAVLFVAFGPIGIASGLTVSALVGLAVTLALQTTLQNILAGFILLNHRLLRLQDTITIGGVTGRVVEIGLVSTLLALDDGSFAQVSNSNLLAGPMVNRTASARLKGEF